MRSSRFLPTITLGVFLAAYSSGAAAQGVVVKAGEIVQPLPAKRTSELNAALAQIARDPKNVDALVNAGQASLELGDLEAARGFFGRARALSSANSAAAFGAAQVALKGQNALEALDLLDEAEKLGMPKARIGADRGLAYDMLGDQTAAQAEYNAALIAQDNDETRRRLALSYAISRDARAFEKTLEPLTNRGDIVANRTRAFGLAILGNSEAAAAIANTVMPSASSSQMGAYLRFLGKLTPAQQAAAANLGIFPRAAQIGRDNDQVAQYLARAAAKPNVLARLTPQGDPLGKPAAKPLTQAKDKTPKPKSSPAAQTAARKEAVSVQPAVPQIAATQTPDSTLVAASNPPARAQDAVKQAAAIAPSPDQATPGDEGGASFAEVFALFNAPSTVFDPARSAGVDVTKITPPLEKAPQKVAVKPAPKTEISAKSDAESVDKKDAKAKKGDDKAAAKSKADAASKSAKSAAAKNNVKDPKAEHPSRIWVQIATGTDGKAIAYDWRKLNRKSPKTFGKLSAFTAPYGRYVRLLVGPQKSQDEARKLTAKLKEEGVSSLIFVSDDGQKIDPLK